ncbi:MAG: SRPBCC family protein [Bdellovibrionota bacterium]
MPRLRMSDTRTIALPEQTLLNFLHDIGNIARYEPKVDEATVDPIDRRHGSYQVRGRFAGMPWKGAFSYTLRGDGFHSEVLAPVSGVRVDGGFRVKALEDGTCELHHWENYRLPFVAAPFLPFLRLYLKRALKEELQAIELEARADAEAHLPATVQ